MLYRPASLALATLALSASAAVAQAPEVGLKVGDVAPDFSLSGATKDGVQPTKVSLSKFKGQTVVLAFFPKARTTGCTAQMTTYRDKWAELFNSGRGVTVIGISSDADTTLANWAKEAGFPMLFASDIGGEMGKAYGAYNEKSKVENRLLYVVGPDGRIAYTVKPFKPMVEDSYLDLGAAVKKASGAK